MVALSLAYVIVVQKAMEVRVAVRQGLQYTLARGGVRLLQRGAVAVTGRALPRLHRRGRKQPGGGEQGEHGPGSQSTPPG